MGYIKEPEKINFVVDSTPLTLAGKKKISEIIAYYKLTGRKITINKNLTSKRIIKKEGNLNTH